MKPYDSHFAGCQCDVVPSFVLPAWLDLWLQTLELRRVTKVVANRIDHPRLVAAQLVEQYTAGVERHTFVVRHDGELVWPKRVKLQ